MIAGNPDKFAFVVEKVSDWSSCGYTNGLMHLYINGIQYPKGIRTATLDMELNYLTGDSSPLVNPVINDSMFDMDKKQLFCKFCKYTFENGNYSYQLPFRELEDAGYCVFIISSSDNIRIQIGGYAGTDNIRYTDEVVINQKELEMVINELKRIKEQV